MLIWYIIGIALCLIISCEYYAIKTGVPTVTSSPAARKKMVELLKQEATQHKKQTPFTVLDLGSGTGKLVLEIAKALPEAQIVGLEISLIPYLLSQLRKRLWRIPNAAFKREDFWAYDLSGVDAIVLYMNGNIRERMAKRLKEALVPGVLVISNETHLPDWTPFEVHQVGLLKLKVVVYRQAVK